jgi:hypothetical protein
MSNKATAAVIMLRLAAMGSADARGGHGGYGAHFGHMGPPLGANETIRVRKSVCRTPVTPWISFPRSWAPGSRMRWESNKESIND